MQTTLADVLAENEPRHWRAWRACAVYTHVCDPIAYLKGRKAERTVEDREHALVRVTMVVEFAVQGCDRREHDGDRAS